ncbi:MAG: (Fe-S)-binding protein [Desulfatibacillum sp.]|nr:(Fe-S)-binding protein [Desulfatibacillum sp.]
MKNINPIKKSSAVPERAYTPIPALRFSMEQVEKQCNDCGVCVQRCAFLGKYGAPGSLARDLANGSATDMAVAFECSLCGLCTTLCPRGCDPSTMFFHMRCQAASRLGDFKEHRALRNYEAQGASPRFSYYALPKGCDTIFFPGCNLPGSRPESTKRLFQHLQSTIPNLGIVMDCCCKPSHDLGRMSYFQAMFGEMREYLVEHKIKKILCACPNCFKVFFTYGEGLEVETVYTVLARTGLPQAGQTAGEVCVHDPCPLRNETGIHEAIREILEKMGLAIAPQSHEGKKTLCCGEGGAVPCLAPDLASKWPETRVRQIHGKPLLTYCAGCALFLGRHTPTHHILDLIFEPEKTMAGKIRPAFSPVTYWNRLQLKKWFRHSLSAEAIRVRNFTPFPLGEEEKNTGYKGLFLAFMGGVLSGFKKNI